MNIDEKIEALRALMRSNGWDAAIISGSDPHCSEYISPRWKTRQWISGFTGSFGTVAVTMDHAGLWTDSRYFIQAEKELSGTCIQLHRLRIPGAVDIPQWLAEQAPKEGKYTVAIDGTSTSKAEADSLSDALGDKAAIVDAPDYIDSIWKDRPGLPSAKARLMPVKYAGADRRTKTGLVRSAMQAEGCGAVILSVLDEIAWVLNIRGGDIAYNPLVLAYLVITREGCILFADKGKFTSEDLRELEEDGTEIRPYEDAGSSVASIARECNAPVMLDSSTLNYHLYNIIRNASSHPVHDIKSPVPLAKAVKNSTEIAGMKKAAVRDGVAMTKFFMWLEKRMKEVRRGASSLSETEAAAMLDSLRREQGASDMSFSTISAYGRNAALPHYSASEEEQSYLMPQGLYLVDSGGQYPFGTTDVTRTIPLGKTTREERRGYTLVLKGMIDLATALFPQGTRGTNLDILARKPLWDNLMNFGHGTGHGVGHCLCVHEGPQAIRHNWVDCELLPGMITSDEPGLYVEGRFGIRHENLILCKEVSEGWLGFETITYVWIDTSAIEWSLLDEKERKWISDYNRKVFRKLQGHLSAKERKWLEKKCLGE